MKIYHIMTGLLGVNSYFLVDENTSEATLIDCGEYANKIEQTERKYGFTVKNVLLTHAHFDHSGCGKKLQERGIKIYISEIDAPKLYNGGTLSESMGKRFDSFIPDGTFSDKEVLRFGEIVLEVILTPGHTDGSCVFKVGNMLFTGDTLLYRSCGRIDFPTGSKEQMTESLNKLFALKGNYTVYPGHHAFSTLDEERKFNPLKLL